MDYLKELTAAYQLLVEIKSFLEENGSVYGFPELDITLPNDITEIEKLLSSNELWGGAGSIADQALADKPMARRKLENELIALGEILQRIGLVNSRTEMWMSVFRKLN